MYRSQVPESYLQKFSFIDDPNRQAYAAKVNYIDDALGQVIRKLHDKVGLGSFMPFKRDILMVAVMTLYSPSHRGACLLRRACGTTPS